jgi:hypothetical protein
MKSHRSHYRALPLLLFSVCLLLSSCVQDKLDPPPEEQQNTSEEEVASIDELEVPTGFDFSTQIDVSLTINDPQNGVRYEVFADNERLFSGFVRSNSLQKTLSLPQTANTLKLWRKTARSTEEFLLPVSGSAMVFDYD